MNSTGIRTAILLTFAACLALAWPGDHASSDPSSDETWTWTPLVNKAKRRCFLADYGGGMSFKLKRKKVAGEKERGILMTSTQDSGFGYVNTGCRLGLDWKLRATFTYHKDRGLRDGGTFAGLEVDHPYVPIGTIPTSFVFVGATWHADGISTFVNDSGTTAGTQASYPGHRSVDVKIRYLDGIEYTISTRATGTAPWDVLYAGDPSVIVDEEEAGLGFGLNNVDRKGSVFLCGLEMEGELFTGIKKDYLDDLQEAHDLETLALESANLGTKYDDLQDAMELIDDIIADLQADYVLGEIDIDYDAVVQALRKAYRNDHRAAEQIAPSRPVQSWGDKEAKRVQKAIAKKKEAIELVQKMGVTD